MDALLHTLRSEAVLESLKLDERVERYVYLIVMHKAILRSTFREPVWVILGKVAR